MPMTHGTKGQSGQPPPDEALQADRERLALAVEASGAGVYDHFVPIEKGCYHSERWAEILGYAPDELPGPDKFMPWLMSRVHPEDTARIEAAYAEFVEGRTPGYHVQVRILHKSGRWIHVEGRSKAVDRDESGRVTRVVGLMVDITERKGAEEQLARLSAEQQTILDTVPATIWHKDTQNRILRVNKAAADSVGMDVRDVDGKTCEELFPDEAAHYYEDDLDVIHSGQPKLGIIEQLQTSSGEKRWVQTDKVPHYNEHGQIAGVIVFAVDITERMRAEGNVAELARFPSENPNPVLRIDADGTILYANPGSALLLDEWGCEFGDCVPEEYARAVTQALRTGGPTEIECSCAGRLLLLTLMPIADADQVHLYGLDITERVRAGKELEQHVRRLGELNAELERSNRDLEEFTYVVSHDLQEPLRKVSAFGQFLLEDCSDELPDVGKDYVRRMQRGALRMKGHIQHLLRLSRVGTRGGELEVVQPAEVVATVLDTFGPEIQNAEADISVSDAMPEVNADPIQLEQIFQNLIANALKFRSPKRRLRIGIRAELADSTVLFSVADNGIGIEPKFHDRVFRVFQRLHHREEYEGTGVGLALCDKIVRRHGGRIWVESEVDVGSKFCFALPHQPTPGKET